MRDEEVSTDTRILDEALTEQLAGPLTEWNFPGAATPRIHHDTEPPEDLDRRATREEQIARTSGLRPTLKHVLDVYGGEWEPAPAAPALPPGRAPDAALASAAARRDAELIEEAAIDLAADWRPLVGPLPPGDTYPAVRREILELMAQGGSEELRRRLENSGFSAVVSIQDAGSDV